MMALIKEILPVLGIGVVFAGSYELVLWLAMRLDKQDEKNSRKEKNKKVSKINSSVVLKKEKNIA